MWTLIKTALGFATGGVSTVATSVLSNWKVVVAGIAAVAAAATIGVLMIERDSARTQVAQNAATIVTLTTQKDALQTNVTDLTGQIGTQNAAIMGWEQQLQAARDASDAAGVAAAAQSAKDANTIASLQARGADKSNMGTCDAEISRIRSGL